jgi:hypothetical protein
MKDAHRYYKHDDEFEYLYVGLGADGTESKEECMNLVETIKVLQKYVQSYKSNNESFVRGKEQQDDFNVKLMQSLKKNRKENGKGDRDEQVKNS